MEKVKILGLLRCPQGQVQAPQQRPQRLTRVWVQQMGAHMQGHRHLQTSLQQAWQRAPAKQRLQAPVIQAQVCTDNLLFVSELAWQRAPAKQRLQAPVIQAQVCTDKLLFVSELKAFCAPQMALSVLDSMACICQSQSIVSANASWSAILERASSSRP